MPAASARCATGATGCSLPPERSSTFLRTGDPAFDGLFETVRSFLEQDVMELVVDGRRVSGFRTPDARSIWIRDHGDMLRTGRYFHPDPTSIVEHFAETQSASGRIFDYVTTFPEKQPCERENWTKYVRVPVEADVEYRFVKAAWLAWQATGDDDWLRRLLPAMDRALRYIMRHPWYWDAELDLVKRAYTIDTWDFAYTAGRHEWLQFQIDDQTFWGIMHGDNSGYYEAFQILGRLYGHVGDSQQATYWARQAEGLKARANDICWNGTFYTHFVKRTPVGIGGVDEASQLSLSNPIDINRGLADRPQAVSILEEYRRRRATTTAFAEWFSIDPPFPDGIFGDDKLVGGAYVNGGIMPLVGGELARAAFEHGFESYGVKILKQYWDLVGASQASYLWYFPDGRPASVEASTSPEAQPTDGWGSSAMLYALVEGLAGIADEGRGFDRIRLSPRWAAAGIGGVEVRIAYAASGAATGYTYQADASQITLEVEAPPDADLSLHLLLPGGQTAVGVTAGGRPMPHHTRFVGASAYLDLDLGVNEAGKATVVVGLASEPSVS